MRALRVDAMVSASLGLQAGVAGKVAGVEEGELPSRGGDVRYVLETEERVDCRRIFAGVLDRGARACAEQADVAWVK